MPAGGGTTDYAVEVFDHLDGPDPYRCFLRADTVLPMMHMEDAIGAMMQILSAPAADIRNAEAYNIQGMSFDPQTLFAEIRRHVPEFRAEFIPDFRQVIADGWPDELEDAAACEDWGWTPKVGLSELVARMVAAKGKPVALAALTSLFPRLLKPSGKRRRIGGHHARFIAPPSWVLMLGWCLAFSPADVVTPTDTDETHVVVLGKESGRTDFPADAVFEEGPMVDGAQWLVEAVPQQRAARSEIHYASGTPFGDYRLYDDQGQVFEEGRWEHGMNVGKLLRYWPNGTLQQQLTFDSQGHGPRPAAPLPRQRTAGDGRRPRRWRRTR